MHVSRLNVADQLLAQWECEEWLQQEPDHPELCLSDLSFHSAVPIRCWPPGRLSLPALCFLSGSFTDIYLSKGGPLKRALLPFRIWGMMQVIDFFFLLLLF